jgi:MFS family permease
MSIFIGAILMITGVVVQTAAQSVGIFVGCRFLMGFGLSLACLAAPVLNTELAFPTHRGPPSPRCAARLGTLGSIIPAWTTYGTFRINNTWAWRIPSVLQELPSVLQVCLIWFFVPEPPRWLIDHGKDETVFEIIAMEDPLISCGVQRDQRGDPDREGMPTNRLPTSHYSPARVTSGACVSLYPSVPRLTPLVPFSLLPPSPFPFSSLFPPGSPPLPPFLSSPLSSSHSHSLTLV